MKQGKEQPLVVETLNGELMVRIGVNVLAGAVAGGNDFHRFDDGKNAYVRDFAITDVEQFAKDVAAEMTAEEEDGSSPLTKLLDVVGQAAIDNGSTGIDHDQLVLFGEKSPTENW